MWSWKKQASSAETDDASALVGRLAVFLAAGLAPRSAFMEWGAHTDPTGVPALIVQALGQGEPVSAAVERITKGQDESWRALGACWWIARQSGAPLAPALGALAESLRDMATTRREVAAAMAGPAATIRLMMALPFVALLGGAVSGINSFALLLGSPVGLTAVALGGLMMAAAGWWLRLLSQRATPPPGSVSIELDLFAIACLGGAPPRLARASVHAAMAEFSLIGSVSDVLGELADLSRRAGVPVVPLASSHAKLQRDIARQEGTASVHRLGVAVVLPLGLLVLPAFVLIAVVPTALAMWSGALV